MVGPATEFHLEATRAVLDPEGAVIFIGPSRQTKHLIESTGPYRPNGRMPYGIGWVTEHDDDGNIIRAYFDEAYRWGCRVGRAPRGFYG